MAQIAGGYAANLLCLQTEILTHKDGVAPAERSSQVGHPRG